MSSSHKSHGDRVFLILVVALTLSGFLIFLSASLGLLTRESSPFEVIALKQLAIVVAGALSFYITSKIPYAILRRYSLYIYSASLLLTLLVFIPGIGFEHGGAKRWLSLGPLSFQPSEFLKAGFVIYSAAWLSSVRRKISSITEGILPMVCIIASAGAILLLQPNTSTLIVIFITGLGMMIIAGARVSHMALIAVVAFLAFALLAFIRPYIKERVLTFLDPSRDPLNSGYQIQQSLIAIGSGGWFGRGFGQSVQKFDYLPEAVGDSIFAVAAEEFGFAGSVVLVGLFLAFAMRGLMISVRASDKFSGLLAGGFVIIIISESFINISSMLGIIPLTGIPLIFVSHGGSAMLFAIAESGVIYGVSKKLKTTNKI